jgi:hypothetical protein
MPYPGSTVYPGPSTSPGGTSTGGSGGTTYPGSTLYPGSTTYPGSSPGGPGDPGGPPVDNEGRLKWGIITERQIEAGIDRGVLYKNDNTATPWNGLTGVDEGGGEDAVEFYMDGRPYLYFPKPKEFSATLSAYTYPDAFSELIGEVEVTDGMYLDSQISDSFGLSYRTKIIDPLRGDNGDYKIHLVYNATVVPSTRAYGTINDSISPVEFQWNLQAVPVPVAGYRPTAHIIIDTRHMDATRISDIEDRLYGNGFIAPHLPEPQAIFDLLTFGNSIIITDNGDGTWTVEGSYENVYMVDNDIFQIENVNATLVTDGIYEVSSTP